MCQSNLFLINALHLFLSQLTFLADCRYSSAPLSCPALICFIQSSNSWGKRPSASSVIGNSSIEQGLWVNKGFSPFPSFLFILVCMPWSCWLCGRWALLRWMRRDWVLTFGRKCSPDMLPELACALTHSWPPEFKWLVSLGGILGAYAVIFDPLADFY